MTFTATLPHSFLATAGQDIDLFPVSPDLTVTEAATLLDESEDFVEALIRIDVLKYKKDKELCLINRDNLLAYKQRRERREAGLAEMVRLDQEMGLCND